MSYLMKSIWIVYTVTDDRTFSEYWIEKHMVEISRSVGIVRTRTQTMEFSFLVYGRNQ
jgi:hypothetical protein